MNVISRDVILITQINKLFHFRYDYNQIETAKTAKEEISDALNLYVSHTLMQEGFNLSNNMWEITNSQLFSNLNVKDSVNKLTDESYSNDLDTKIQLVNALCKSNKDCIKYIIYDSGDDPYKGIYKILCTTKDKNVNHSERSIISWDPENSNDYTKVSTKEIFEDIGEVLSYYQVCSNNIKSEGIVGHTLKAYNYGDIYNYTINEDDIKYINGSDNESFVIIKNRRPFVFCVKNSGMVHLSDNFGIDSPIEIEFPSAGVYFLKNIDMYPLSLSYLLYE